MTGHQADSQLVHTHTNVPVVYDCIGHIIATSCLRLASPLTGHASILTIISATTTVFFLFWVSIHNVGISCNNVGLIYKNIVSKQILSQYIEKQGGIKTLAKDPG